MRNLISRYAKGKIIIPLFLCAGILYAIMLTITIPKVMSYSDGMKILDMMPTGYDGAYVNELLIKLGEEGRHAYLFSQIPLDMFYPLLFGISLALIMAYLLNRLGKFNGSLFYLCFMPLLATLFDYCENMGIIRVLHKYPDYSNLLIKTTTIFSVLKSTSTTISFVMIIVLIMGMWIKKLSVKKAHR